MNLNTNYLFAFILSFFHFISYAQLDDFESWTDLGVQKELNKNITVKIEESIRLNQYSRNIKSFNTDLGVEYKLNKAVEFGITYRISSRKKPNGYFFKHRGSLDITYKKEIDKFKFSYRNRTQVIRDTYFNEQTDLYPTAENRNRIKVLYNIRGVKTDPYFAMEFFHQLSRLNFYSIFETRYKIGVSRKLPNKLDLDLGVLYKVEYNKTIENILVLQVSLQKNF